MKISIQVDGPALHSNLPHNLSLDRLERIGIVKQYVETDYLPNIDDIDLYRANGGPKLEDEKNFFFYGFQRRVKLIAVPHGRSIRFRGYNDYCLI